MATPQPFRVKTIHQYHHILGLPKPQHPLISVIHLSSFEQVPITEPMRLLYDFYCIALKKNINFTQLYGQQEYDFDEGVMSFMSPGQVFGIEYSKEQESKQSGWMLLIHPDFLWDTPLAKTIQHYEYFDYAANEALYLSEKEETIINGIIQNIEQEYHTNIDHFSQDIIISQLEVLLNYAERFYHRQFLTRKKVNHGILTRLEDILSDYFKGDDLGEKGLPTVEYIAETLNVSPNYLSGVLKVLTGQSTQQHIHDKLIEKAKEKLSTTDLSVSEIAYTLGFEHSQSFSRLFKAKTHLSPLAFRQSFH
jgi:AraC family transcriptional regulator, transcriptional activator of pobA